MGEQTMDSEAKAELFCRSSADTTVVDAAAERPNAT